MVDYASTPNSSAGTTAPSLNSVQIIDGRLILTSATGQRSEYANIDADIRTANNRTSGTVSWKNGTLPINLNFAAGNNAGQWTVSKLDAAMGDVTAAFTGQIDANSGTVDGALRVKPSPLAGLPINSPYKPTGTVSADVKVTGPYKDPALTGTVRIANLEVTGGRLSQPLRATALELNLTPRRISAKPFSLQVGPTVVQAAFQLTDYKVIDANVSTKDAAIQDLLAMAQIDDIAGTGVATLQVRAAGPLANPQLTGSGSIANADLRLPALQPNLKIDTAQIKFLADSATIDNAAFHIGNSNWQGAIRLRDFKYPQFTVSLKVDQLSNVEIQSWFPPAKGESKPIAITGDIAVGKMQLNDLTLTDLKSGIALRDRVLTLEPLSAAVYGGRLTGSAAVNLNAQPAAFTLKTHLDKIEAEQLLAATTPLRKVVTGPLTADANLHFSPKPGENFARTLDGAIKFHLAQGKLIPLNLLNEMGSLLRFLKPLNANSAGTPFLGLSGQFQLSDGIAETQDLRLEMDRAAALITGSLNLADQTLNLRMLTTLNKQLSEEVGGTRIGAFLSAAIAGPQGELLMPSLVKGTFSKPILSPDTATLGKMKLDRPQSIQQGVQGILDIFKGKKKQP
jgi:autotransporter translocation and assembly factor TamB